MPRMQITKDRVGVVLGPCPGCEMWTVQYDHTVPSQWQSHAEFADVIEGLLWDHLAACRGLQEIVYEKI